METKEDTEELDVRAEPTGILTWVLHRDDLATDVTRIVARIQVKNASIRVGRGPNEGEAAAPAGSPTDVLVPDPYMSERHFKITRRDAVDVIEDNESRHGTRVNGQPISGPATLVDGCLIEAGRSLFCYRCVPAARAALVGEGPVALPPTRTFCPELAEVLLQIRRLARKPLSIVLLGNRGAGKEIAARYVHEMSGRRGRLVEVDCGSIPESLVEAELFGHQKGAFTMAGERTGLIRSADGGTLFLDELGNLAPAAQQRLLRTVQEQAVRPLGADKPISVDVRWIAATNAPVEDAASSLRRDLFDRLAGATLRLPSLRERREDLGVLAAYLLKNAGFSKVPITRAAAEELFLGPLEGNIRELRNTLISAATLAAGVKIDAHHLPRRDSVKDTQGEHLGAEPASEIRANQDEDERPGLQAPESIAGKTPRKQRPSRDEIVRALEASDGVQDRAARLLGTHEKQLRRWMDDHGIPRATRKPTLE